MLPYYLSLAAGILCGAIGQLSLKAGSARTSDVIAQFMNPFTLLGFGLYFAAAVFYIASIKKIPISVAYPSVSISYVVVALAAHLFWGEPFAGQQIVALALICGGILVLFH
jgi:small multidrug resistance pump